MSTIFDANGDDWYVYVSDWPPSEPKRVHVVAGSGYDYESMETVSPDEVERFAAALTDAAKVLRDANQ